MASSWPFPDPDIGGNLTDGAAYRVRRSGLIGRCAAPRERRTGRYAPAPPCAPRPPSVRPRSRRSPPASRRRSSAAASSSRRPSSPRPPRPRRSRSASWSRARARVTSGRASCRCGPTWPRTRCPTTTRRRSSAASASPTRSMPTASSAAARRRRCGSSARSAATGGFQPLGEGARLVALALVRCSRTAPCSYLLLRHPRPLPARRRADLRDVRPRTDRLLGGPDRAALVRREAGPDGRRADARAAAHDGRVRRGVLGFRLEAPVRFPGRKPPGRHALAALRHLRHRRPSTGRDRPYRRHDRVGLRRDARASRSSTSASTTSSTSRPGSRSPRGSGCATPAASPLIARVSAGIQALEARARA